MAVEGITSERMDYTIDVLVAMIVDELSTMIDIDRNELLPDFILSKTGKALYDSSTGFWKLGPSYLADLYLEEKKIM